MKTAAYGLNQVSSKSIPKMSYEFMYGRKPNLNHFHVWSCKVKVRPYVPRTRKLGLKLLQVSSLVTIMAQETVDFTI